MNLYEIWTKKTWNTQMGYKYKYKYATLSKYEHKRYDKTR